MSEAIEKKIAIQVPNPEVEARRSQAGLAYGLAAYTIWGFIPLYFRALAPISPLIILCHRVVWSALFIALIVSLRREWKPVLQAATNGRRLRLLAAGGVLVASNWLIFIYAVSTHQLLQASLGYFLNPLLSVALGVICLRERLRPWQWMAVAIAGVALVHMAWHGTGVPWIAVSLALTFGFYGLVRKQVDIHSLHGLLVETAVLFPAALVALFLLPGHHVGAGWTGVLSLSGIITAVPLLCFGAALRRLRLSTVGFLQYVGPTLQFLVAACVFGEPLDRVELTSFGLCWLAIGVYLTDSLASRRSPSFIADEPE